MGNAMSDVLEYKGYQASVKYSSEDRRLFGEVLHIDSLLTFHGESVEELEQAFISTIDAYLDFCARRNREPNKPFKGSFNVRVGPDLHKAVAHAAARQSKTLNEFVCVALANAVQVDALPPSNRSVMGVAWGNVLTAAEFGLLGDVAGERADMLLRDRAEVLREWLSQIEYKDFLTQEDKDSRTRLRNELRTIESELELRSKA